MREETLTALEIYGITADVLLDTGNGKLNDRQLKAVLACIENGYNFYQAWKTAGYSVNSRQGAAVESSRFFNSPNICRLLQIAMVTLTEGIKKTAHGLVVDHCMRVMRARIRDYINKDGTLAFDDFDEVDDSVIKSIERIPTRAGDRLKYTFYDKIEAANTMKLFISIAEGYDLRVKVEGLDVKSLSEKELRDLAGGK